jgi:hypothetical protein
MLANDAEMPSILLIVPESRNTNPNCRFNALWHPSGQRLPTREPPLVLTGLPPNGGAHQDLISQPLPFPPLCLFQYRLSLTLLSFLPQFLSPVDIFSFIPFRSTSPSRQPSIKMKLSLVSILALSTVALAAPAPFPVESLAARSPCFVSSY